ncbi:N-acetylneuraminate lyase [Microcaecilia unicolor]|uniref:N-acetylneuraminate lyase n=1 Tax=Microcaecilia unicolor TaxID=1415580 RepID=A0A6P7YA33_9AMPH|nr:N-acetylneuraminate lyase [Microcaecilia unicolor]XP_030061776.1 N-acetylneuraminate lyase [Microcaecilia unicolor]XP_030061777.1 N-acetylneuraminate lyase [Microcaecilia unicolor]XP_030061779.1 N-acetylneuraminate lyase [Microcaecilia unicolor]XP_030061780.1 N-acetylneuraminate lyase [Microcaecilia unicolor]
MESSQNKIRGLVAATVTPMMEDGKINLSVIGQYVDYLSNVQGVRSVFVNGTTAEGLSLTTEERKQLSEEWVKQAVGKLDQVIVHVGSLCLKEAEELAAHAAEIKADAISVMAPSFLKPPNKDALISFLREVAAAAPSVPFYYYHIPKLTGITAIRIEDLLVGIKSKIPTFQGVKFSDTDLLDFGQCVHKYESEQFTFLYGVDEQLLGALAMGSHGAIGSTYNYIGKTTKEMLAAFECKDLEKARKIQFLMQEFFSYVIRHGFGIPETKAIISVASNIPMGPPRLPLQKSSDEYLTKIIAQMKRLALL